MAKVTQDENDKARWQELARRWIDLAEQMKATGGR
jgi:hypothetical protein